MSNWYGADELAAMKLRGLPTSGPGVRIRAKNEGWGFCEVKSKGGKNGFKTVYFVPESYRSSLTALPQAVASAPAKIANNPAAPGVVTLTLTVSLTEATYITGWLAEQAQK